MVRALLTPLVRIQDVEVEPTGTSKEWTVTATVANEGYLDTSMEQARRTNIARPDQITLTLAPGTETGDPPTVEFPFMRGTRESAFVSLYRASWTVRGDGGTRLLLTLRSEKGGSHSREVVLEGQEATSGGR